MLLTVFHVLLAWSLVRVAVAVPGESPLRWGKGEGGTIPASFLMYLRANVKLVSFLSTMRTFPNAPFPTTRSSRK